MKFDILTLFPQMFTSLKESIIGKAIEKKTNRNKPNQHKGFFRK